MVRTGDLYWRGVMGTLGGLLFPGGEPSSNLGVGAKSLDGEFESPPGYQVKTHTAIYIRLYRKSFDFMLMIDLVSCNSKRKEQEK